MDSLSEDQKVKAVLMRIDKVDLARKVFDRVTDDNGLKWSLLEDYLKRWPFIKQDLWEHFHGCLAGNIEAWLSEEIQRICDIFDKKVIFVDKENK